VFSSFTLIHGCCRSRKNFGRIDLVRPTSTNHASALLVLYRLILDRTYQSMLLISIAFACARTKMRADRLGLVVMFDLLLCMVVACEQWVHSHDCLVALFKRPFDWHATCGTYRHCSMPAPPQMRILFAISAITPLLFTVRTYTCLRD